MICKDCKLKKICKNYDYLIEHKELTISNCTYIQLENPYTFMDDLCKPMDIKEPFKPKIVKSTNNNCNAYEIDKEDKIVQCPTCGENTFESDIKECDKCHKKVCPNCSTDVTTMAKDNEEITTMFLCNECYGIDESKETYDSSSSIKDLLNFDLNKEGGH